MRHGWCVRVSVFDDLVVTISERELCGPDLTDADEDLIRDCARHLLSFVGEKRPATNAVDPSAQPQERRHRATESSDLHADLAAAVARLAAAEEPHD